MHDRKKIVVIVSIIVLCIIGFGYYGFEATKKTPTKNNVNKADNEKKIIKPIEVPKDRIKTIEGNKDVIFLSDDRIVYTEDTTLKVTDRKTNTDEIIKKFDNLGSIEHMRSNGNYIAWIEYVYEKSEDNEGYLKLTVYDVEKKKEVTIDKDKFEVTKDNFRKYKYQLGRNLAIKDNKVIYFAVSYEGKNTINTIMSYDFDKKDKKALSKMNIGKAAVLGDDSVDIDINKGYMVFEEQINDTEKSCVMNLLTLVNLKDGTKKIFLKTSDIISTSIEYPNVVFKNKDKIHVYNIEKKKDDFVLQCGNDVCNVDIKDCCISWNDNKIYVYSIKDKKKYEIDNGWFKDSPDSEGHKNISGNVMYWKDYGKVRYIKMSDIKG